MRVRTMMRTTTSEWGEWCFYVGNISVDKRCMQFNVFTWYLLTGESERACTCLVDVDVNHRNDGTWTFHHHALLLPHV